MPLAPTITIARCKHEPARSALIALELSAYCHALNQAIRSARPDTCIAAPIRCAQCTLPRAGSLRHHHHGALGAAWDLSRRMLWRSYGRRVYPLARPLIYTWP